MSKIPEKSEETVQFQLLCSPFPLGGPTTFPELTGLTGDEAKAYMQKHHPNLYVSVLKQGSMVTKDFRHDRVRVFVDESNIVVGIPTRG